MEFLLDSNWCHFKTRVRHRVLIEFLVKTRRNQSLVTQQNLKIRKEKMLEIQRRISDMQIMMWELTN